MSGKRFALYAPASWKTCAADLTPEERESFIADFVRAFERNGLEMTAGEAAEVIDDLEFFDAAGDGWIGLEDFCRTLGL